MTPATIVTLSSVLAFGAPLALAVHQLWSLRRTAPRGDDDPPRAVPPAPLPDCLQPHVLLSPRRLRELADA